MTIGLLKLGQESPVIYPKDEGVYLIRGTSSLWPYDIKMDANVIECSVLERIAKRLCIVLQSQTTFGIIKASSGGMLTFKRL
jgi:hypothetical protein